MFENPKNNQDQPKDLSKRKFLKTLGAGVGLLAGASLAPKEVFGQDIEKEKLLLDIVVNGTKVTIFEADIQQMERNGEDSKEMQAKHMELSFDKKMQEQIVAILGGKLSQGLSKSKELGFDFNFQDNYHVHLLADRERVSKMFGSYALKLGELTKADVENKQLLLDVLKNTDALMFHAAEWPTRKQMLDPEFWKKYHNRTIVSDNDGVFVLYDHAKNNPERWKTMKGNIPKWGNNEDDYNVLRNKNTVDFARPETTGLGAGIGLSFIPDEEDGIKIDNNLPKIKIVITGINTQEYSKWFSDWRKKNILKRKVEK